MVPPPLDRTGRGGYPPCHSQIRQGYPLPGQDGTGDSTGGTSLAVTPEDLFVNVSSSNAVPKISMNVISGLPTQFGKIH